MEYFGEQKTSNLTWILLFAIVLYIWHSKSKIEPLETQKRDINILPRKSKANVLNFANCDDCKIWNIKDAQSQCDKTCKLEFPDKNATFTGNYTENKDFGVSCECSFKGAYKKQFIQCPSSHSLGTPEDCFFWNPTEANNKCPFMCQKYLPGKYANWTGEWENTTPNTSACECEYYD